MITHQFEAEVKRVDATDVEIPVTVTLSYDAGTDPYAVQAIFEISEEEDRVWHFSRELMSAGVYSFIPVGQGDVKFRYFPTHGMLLMCLRAPHANGEAGHCDIALPHAEVIKFLGDTQELFKEASGDCSALVDEFLKEVLEG